MSIENEDWKYQIAFSTKKDGLLQTEFMDAIVSDIGYSENVIVLESHEVTSRLTAHAAEVERLTAEIRVQRDEIEILTTVRDGWQEKFRAAEDIVSNLTAERDLLRAEADRLERDFNAASLSAERAAAERDAYIQRFDVADHDAKKAWSALDQIAFHLHGGQAGECGHSELPLMVFDLVGELAAVEAERDALKRELDLAEVETAGATTGLKLRQRRLEAALAERDAHDDCKHLQEKVEIIANGADIACGECGWIGCESELLNEGECCPQCLSSHKLRDDDSDIARFALDFTVGSKAGHAPAKGGDDE